MALEKLTDCNCLRLLEKDMMSQSLQTNLHIVIDIIRNQTAKFKPDAVLVKRLKSQQIFIENLKTKVDNTPTCKP